VIETIGRQTLPEQTFPELPGISGEFALTRGGDNKENNGIGWKDVLRS
jgi:hypothetical protein